MITVKVVVVPGLLKEVVLDSDTATVADALAAAEVSAEGRSLQVDGITASTSDGVSDGSRIIVSKAAKAA